MFIKICANTNPEDALTAAQLGADAVGFVFAPSKRRVSGEQVAEMVARLPDCLETVGVFATSDPKEIEHLMTCTGLKAAQLHGAFDRELVRLLWDGSGGDLRLVQAVAYAVDAAERTMADAQFVAALQAVFDEPRVWAVLLDAAKAGVSGGLGVAFDWKHVGSLVEAAIGGRMPRPRVILAGGLRPENVGDAIAALRPWGVDVASGVEMSPGKKDWEKMRAFIANARAAARAL
jgi:phosphoribosylanthranilate isomerase